MTRNKQENADFLMDDDIDEEENTSFESESTANPLEKESEPLIFNVMQLHFSVGEIFWTMTSGKKITLFHSGDWIRKDYLNKFVVAGKKIEISPEVNGSFCSTGLNLFEKLKSCEDENEKAQIREKIITWLGSGYWSGEEEVSLLDLIFVCEQIFYDFSEEEEQFLYEISGDLFKRSSVVGALLVTLALVMGYTDFNFLKDIYHISYLFDVSLDQTVLSTNLISALEHERLRPQSWHGSLQEAEIDFFKAHSKESVEAARGKFEKRISNPGLFHFIETHHERINGKGFPLGLLEGEISDMEGLIIFVNNRFPYENMEFGNGDSKGFFKNLMEKNEHVEAVLINRIKKIITNEFESSEVDHSVYLEVSGL